MYAQFAKEAKEEGFNKIAFCLVCGQNRKEHEERSALQTTENNTVFEKSEPVVWQCANWAISMRAPRLLLFAPFVTIPRPTSRFSAKLLRT